MIYHGLYVEIHKNRWNSHIPNLWPSDVGELMKEEYYEIKLVVIELLEYVIIHI